ncbi:MAG: hypothetical protein DMD91_16315 [Candidatus Rokuibacteriota bacterium]|nr:MAG: hypothetical protein DMD91_16315 [Candidatus Rokubacteria bacterium]
MKRPPLVLVLVAIVMIALGETSGALMSLGKSPIGAYARARIAANAPAHGLTGSLEYDDEIRARTTFATEAGLSFFHTHAEGVGLIVLFVSTLVASVTTWRTARRALYTLIAIGGLFPLGYLVYGFAALELGRDAAIELAETWILTPLGSGMIAGALGAAAVLAIRLVRRARA